MPAVKKGQSLGDYLSICIPRVLKEHPEKSQKQAAGQCAGMYRQHKTVSKSLKG
jgi:hypothetical protein